MIEIKEGIKLTREEFDRLNDCDQLSLFTIETDRYLAGLLDEEHIKFDYLDHFCYLIDQLYKKFEYVIVTPNNKFFGFRDSNYKHLYDCNGAYEKAKNLE